MSFWKICLYSARADSSLNVFDIFNNTARAILFHLQLTAVIKAGGLTLFKHIILCIIG